MVSIGASISKSHQGQRHQMPRQSPDVRVQSFLLNHHAMNAWQTGGVHVRPKVALRCSDALAVTAVHVGASILRRRRPCFSATPFGIDAISSRSNLKSGPRSLTRKRRTFCVLLWPVSMLVAREMASEARRRLNRAGALRVRPASGPDETAYAWLRRLPTQRRNVMPSPDSGRGP